MQKLWKRLTKLNKIYSIAILVNNIEILFMLTNSNKSYQLRMVSNFNWSHNLPFKLFFRTRKTIFNFFNCHLSSSPLSFKNLRWITITNFFFENKSTIINNILLGILSHLFNNKLSEIYEILFFWRRIFFLFFFRSW